jgi:hypothetical protein
VKASQAATPVALIVLAAGFAVYLAVFDRGTVSDADRAARPRDVFPSFRVEDVTRVELDQPGDALVLERDADAGPVVAWRMLSPRRGPADPGAVDALLRELDVAVRVRDVDGSIDAGLATPQVKGVVTLGPLVYRFALGGDTPRPEGAAYLKLDGEGTVVVSRSLRTQLLRPSDAYRPRALVPLRENDVAALRVTRPDGSAFSLERRGAELRLGPGGLRADRTAADALLLALADARAETFLDDAAGERALGTAVTTLSVDTSSSAPSGQGRVALKIGGVCPTAPRQAVVVRTSPDPMAACVPRSFADALAVDPATLVDAAPFFAHADEIEELRLERATGGARVEIARSGSGWHERAPEVRDLSGDEADSATALVDAIVAVRAKPVRASTPADASFAADGKVTVVRTGGSVTEVLEVSAPQRDGTTLARRVDDGAMLTLPIDAGRRMRPHPVALRAGSLWSPSFDAADIVAIDDGCGAPQRLEWRAGAWTSLGPAGAALDARAVSDLTGALAHARARAWISETDDGTFGLSSRAACHVTFTVARPGDAGTRRMTLSFGTADGDGFDAAISGDPAVFVAPGSLRDVVGRSLLEGQRDR